MKSLRTVLITGAAGGLGQALVSEFSAQGWGVAAAFHRLPGLLESDHVLQTPLDVESRESVEAAVELVLSRWGRLDVLVNNAGLALDRSLPQMGEAEWDKVMAVNLKGAFLCSQAALRPMIRQRDGHIVNVSSFSGRVGARGQTNYAAAKAGLIGLTQSLAREAGSRNIRVNAILPGVLPTPMTTHLGPEAMERFAAANVLGRVNEVSEVARFVVFLAGLQNVSGQVFQLDSRIAPWT